ncbi:MAG: hypothetical protein LBQ30_08390 [Treponema sp.]|jgi:hypothetical protein|nr:hypothetical protein [Treponema sp.]
MQDIDFETMDDAALGQTLGKLLRLLEELEEDREMVLGQTGVHVPGSYGKRYDREIEEIQQQIDRVKERLARPAVG